MIFYQCIALICSWVLQCSDSCALSAYDLMVKPVPLRLTAHAKHGSGSKAVPHAMSLFEARQVFAAHDSEGRFRNTQIKKVGDVRANGRIFSIFDLNFSNPISQHGIQLVAILEGRQFLGAYQTSGSVISIKHKKIIFACNRYDALHTSEVCKRKYFQILDLSRSRLPRHRLIKGDFVELWDSI